MLRFTVHFDKRVIGEVLALLFIPIALLLIHWIIPHSAAEKFYFYPWRPTVVSAWTAAVLHSSWKHVTSNALAFAFAILPTFAIYNRWGQRRTMWFLIVLILITTPVTKFISNVLLLRDYFGVVGPTTNMKGFSGIASAFVGMLLASVGFYVNNQTRTTAGYWVILGTVYLGLGILAVQYSLPADRLVVSILALLGGFALIAYRLRDEFGNIGISTALQRVKSADSDFDLVFLSIAFTVVFFVGMFPSDFTGGGTTTNIVAHFVGLIFGFVVTALTIMGWLSLNVVHGPHLQTE